MKTIVMLMLLALGTTAHAADLPFGVPSLQPDGPDRPWTESERRAHLDARLRAARTQRDAGIVLTVFGGVPVVLGGGLAALSMVALSQPCRPGELCERSGAPVVLGGLMMAAGAPFVLLGAPLWARGGKKVRALAPTVDLSSGRVGVRLQHRF